jgi:tether containing UBX domain for GLUT4
MLIQLRRHRSRQLDLSLSFRLSGLSSGAKLELVQQSRSPSVITVAVQLPESEAQDAPNGRLLDKFPSTTTLWQLLRIFEAGVAGNGSKRNFTARAMPATDNGDTGAGRLYYQMPVFHVMGRELSSFTDLQKSLAQLGFSGGNILLRLSFRTTQEPLEEAMLKISGYFSGFEDSAGVKAEAAEAIAPVEPAPVIIDQIEPASQLASSTLEQPTPDPISIGSVLQPDSSQIPSEPTQAQSITVFRPPELTRVVLEPDGDHRPTFEHLLSYQKRLKDEAQRQNRMLSNAEIAAKAAAEQEKLANIAEVEIKIRFPEQSQVVTKFGQPDTGATLYRFTRGCLNKGIANEPFSLTFASGSGELGRTSSKSQTAIPDSDQTLLIKDLGMKGRLLINFTWDDKASMAARASGPNHLKPELCRIAQELKVPDIPEARGDSSEYALGGLGAALRGNSEAENTRRKGGGGGTPKWFKMPGKK